MLAFFDIETTGLEADCEMTCGVVRMNDEVNIFYTAMDMVQFMRGCADDTVFVTFNGLSFDFRVLSTLCAKNQSQMLAEWAAKTAASTRHIDIMFAFLAENGYYTSMNSFAEPLEVAKTWEGAEAARSVDLPKIVAYCESDVEILQKVYESGVEKSYLKRKAKGTGKTVVWVLPPAGFRNVDNVLKMLKTRLPDQKWMTEPPPVPSGQVQWTYDYIPAE